MKRQTFLIGAVALPGLSAVLPGSARADAKASKSDMQYQTTPNNGRQCSGCTFFVPGTNPSDDGTCKVVDGSISPHGYCIGYSAKS